MKWLVAVAIVFFLLITDILIGVSIYYNIRSQQSWQTKPGYSNITDSATGQTKPGYSNMTGQTKPDNSNITGQIKPDNSNKTGPAKAAVCLRPECEAAAALMVKKMNRSVDPCVDFHQYACGRFIREEVLPPGQTELTIFRFIANQNQLVMKDIISGEIKSDQPKYLQNMKLFYKSCMDIAQIEKTGLASFLKHHYFQDWPTLNSGWSDTAFDLKDVIARYAVVNIWPILGVSSGQDYLNSSRNVLILFDGDLVLSQEYYSLPRNDSRLLTYQKFYVNITEALGADVVVAEFDAKNVVDLEIELSKIMPSAAERRDFHKVYNPMKISELDTVYPSLGLPRAIRAVYEIVLITIPDDETIINMFPAYMNRLESVLTRFSNRTIQNLFSFELALQKVQDMSKRMRAIWMDFDKVFAGKTEETPRWQDCLSRTSITFSKGMSKQFVTRKFSEQAKTYMEEMIDNLKKSFREIIDESTWMGPPTKEAAYKKLALMKFKIGYPNTGFTNEYIENQYEYYVMREHDYEWNKEIAINLNFQNELISLRKPIDKNEWSVDAHDANAFYSPHDNQMVLPAGVLQIPMYSQTFQDYVNYGAIGMVIGHEITHGFDIHGSQFDGDGNLIDWWQKSIREVFLNKSKCIQDQCSRFWMDEINMTLNGINMLDESIADNGGLKDSFRAYKKLVSRKGENPVLPHLGLTQDQLFFLAFAQLWCEKMTKETMIYHVTSGKHPLGKFRVIGTLQNSEAFAKAYNCSSGSYMNPVKKCAVW